MVKTKKELSREFSDFAKKISQLEAYRKEINSLNVKGFENEARAIRIRLKDVNSIPFIASKMNELKKKIAARTTLSVKFLNEAKKIEVNTGAIKGRIRQLEELLERKRNLSNKKVLSRQEAKAIMDIPLIEKELRALKVEFEAHSAGRKVKIDSGVGTLVDSKFDDFISEIKAELSERVREKETESERKLKIGKKEAERKARKEKTGMERELKFDLGKRKELFARKYKEIVNEYHDRYKKKVENELHNEVRRNFNKQLNARLNAEKHKVVVKIIEDNAKQLNKRKNKMVFRLGREYSHKKKMLDGKMRELERRKMEVAELGRKLRDETGRKRSKLNRQFLGRKKKVDILLAILAKERIRHEQQFELKVRILKREMHNEIMRKALGVEQSAENKIKQEVARREREIRAQLERDYAEKVRAEMRKSKARLEAKKDVLQKHILEQARKLLD